MSPRRRRDLLVGVVTPVLALVALDLALSILLHFSAGRLAGIDVAPYDLLFGDRPEDAVRDEDPYFCFDSDLGWCIRPNGVSKNGLFRANAVGLRGDRDYAPQPPTGVTRIAVFGESFVHGDKVANEETWPHLLEIAAADVEVLNFGVNGYGTDQALLRYRRDGVAYHPQV